MRVLIACEESQEVCKAFRSKGHEAYSCDILPCSGGHPEWHYEIDIFATAEPLGYHWDLLIAHPPCTFFSRAGIQFLHTQKGRKEKLQEAYKFVLALWNADVPKTCIENPVGWLNTHWRKPSQIIHPWYFGDDEMKETCLWLRGLSRLNGLHKVAMNPSKFHPKSGGSRIGSDGKIKNKYFMSRMHNAKDRSKTFPGIAKAMAEQWG